MTKNFIIKISILISLFIVFILVLHLNNIQGQKQKEMNDQELSKLEGNVLNIKIINKETIETDAQIYVNPDTSLINILRDFFSIKTTDDGSIKSIKNIDSNWTVYVNNKLVDINTYVPLNSDMIVISNNN